MRTRLYNRWRAAKSPARGEIESRPMPARTLRPAVLVFAAAAARRARRRPSWSRRGSTRRSTPPPRTTSKRVLARAEKDGAALVVADALDARRPSRLDARDELGDPPVEGAGRDVRGALRRAGGVGRVLPPALRATWRRWRPGTNTGAAHPGGRRGRGSAEEDEREGRAGRARVRADAWRKQRGRNVEKAEAAVEKSLSYTEAEAKEAG